MGTVWLLRTLEEKLANYVCGSCLSDVRNEFYIWDASQNAMHFPVPPAQLLCSDEMPPASSVCRKRRLHWSHVWNVPSFLPSAMAMSPRQCQHTGQRRFCPATQDFMWRTAGSQPNVNHSLETQPTFSSAIV